MTQEGKPAIHVLLVEDHAAVARVTSELLRRLGYQVTAASSVDDALRAVEHPEPGEGHAAAPKRIDVVITDLNLPDGNGAELMSRLAQRFGVPGIALSATEPDPMAKLDRSVFASQLVKPVAMQTLHSAIEQALQRHRPAN